MRTSDQITLEARGLALPPLAAIHTWLLGEQVMELDRTVRPDGLFLKCPHCESTLLVTQSTPQIVFPHRPDCTLNAASAVRES